MKFIFVFIATIGLAKSLWSQNPSMKKNFGMSEMMKRIVSPDADWDEDFGDLPEWLQDWGNTEVDDAY